MEHKFQKAKCWFLMALTTLIISFSAVGASNASTKVNNGTEVGICSDKPGQVDLPPIPIPPEV